MSWSPWTVTPPVLISSYPAAGAECGGASPKGHQGQLHHVSPAAGDALNYSGPMAAREPVTARVKFLQEPMRGISKGFALSFANVSHAEKLSDEGLACPTKGFPNPEKEFPRTR